MKIGLASLEERGRRRGFETEMDRVEMVAIDTSLELFSISWFVPADITADCVFME